jgi:uncharacterized membrane protein
VAEKFLATMKRVRLGGDGGDQALALVGDAGATLGAWVIGIFDRGGLAGDESVLAIVDGARVGRRGARKIRERRGG